MHGLNLAIRGCKGGGGSIAGASALAAGPFTHYLPAMCGRYASFLPPEAIAAMLHTVNPLPNIAAMWDLAPTEGALVVRRYAAAVRIATRERRAPK